MQQTPAKLISHSGTAVIPTRYHMTRMTDGSRDRRLISRRSLLIGGSGFLAAYIVGCGDDEEGAPEQTASPTTAATRTPAAATATPAPGLRWRKLEPAGNVPPARRDHSLVTDGRSLLLFGGRNDSGDLGDFWTYEFSGDAWLQPDAGEGPAARFGHNAVYDEQLGGMVVFGGQAGGSFFNDTWVLDGQTAAWRQLDSGGGPSQRYGAASALDASSRLIVSHGFTNQGRFDDTWLFPPAGPWADISASGARPVKRCLVRGVWDARRDRFLIFGGQTDGTPFLGDLWALDANGWTEIPSEPKPSPRNFYAMVATDSALVVLFGGNTGDDPGPTNDLWFLDTANDTWTQMLAEGEAPSPRYGHDAVWLPESRKLIVSGGRDASGELNDLWELTVPA
jgi:Galactose oxidase, central domain/Kelch motif